MATFCNIDLWRDIPEVVIENCDQPPFLAIALERASRDQDNLPVWACLFAEAGLRSAAVASTLATRELPIWRQVASKIDHEKWWSFSNVVQSSFYTDCLVIARELNIALAESLLLAFRAIPGPNSEGIRSLAANFFQRQGWLLFVFIYVVVVGSLAVLVGTAALGEFHARPTVSQVIALGLIPISPFVAFVCLWFRAAAGRRAGLYVEILNLRTVVKTWVFEPN